MRVVVAGILVASLIAVAPAPNASACRIDLTEPTHPRWSDGCTNPDNLITHGDVNSEVDADLSMEDLDQSNAACQEAESLCSKAISAHAGTSGWNGETLDLSVTVDGQRTMSSSYQTTLEDPFQR